MSGRSGIDECVVMAVVSFLVAFLAIFVLNTSAMTLSLESTDPLYNQMENWKITLSIGIILIASLPSAACFFLLDGGR
jgi:divalent metal cation (Fe/Co/Zn/Cd) transporter